MVYTYHFRLNPFKPEFPIVIFIMDEDDLMWVKTYRILPCIGKPVSGKSGLFNNVLTYREALTL